MVWDGSQRFNFCEDRSGATNLAEWSSPMLGIEHGHNEEDCAGVEKADYTCNLSVARSTSDFQLPSAKSSLQCLLTILKAPRNT
jgi:hypothetical protein